MCKIGSRTSDLHEMFSKWKLPTMVGVSKSENLYKYRKGQLIY